MCPLSSITRKMVVALIGAATKASCQIMLITMACHLSLSERKKRRKLPFRRFFLDTRRFQS